MIKFKFELIPEEGTVKPYIEPYGYIFRAILMNWLKQLEPKMVHELHDFNEIRPYSIKVSYRKDKLIIYLNSFHSRLSNILINDLINEKNKSFTISNQKFLLKKVVFEEFLLSELWKKARTVKNFKLEFLEPTYFNTTRSNNVIRLPIPELIFGNLINLWNKYYDGEFKFDRIVFLDWVNRNIFPSSFKVKTQAKEMGEKIPAVGVVGWVNFKINKTNSDYAKYIDCLCRFGELSNLGGNRTAGFGVIQYTALNYIKS